MAEDDQVRDEEWFNEVYGSEYKPSHEGSVDGEKALKRRSTSVNVSAGDSDQEEEHRDPNAVPTDFTSREAKVWEAKAKAIERNWKRRKEEELRCSLCGETGHFPQGCPSTLRSNRRKSGEAVERVHLKDKRLKPRIIGTGGQIIQGIERDTGCHLQLEDTPAAGYGAFCVRITGPDHVAVLNARHAVNKIVDRVLDEWNQLSVKRPHGLHHGSSADSPGLAQMQHVATQKLQEKSNFYGVRALHSLDENHSMEQVTAQTEVRRHWETKFSEDLNGRAAPGPGKAANAMVSERQNAYYYGLNQGGGGSYPDLGGGIAAQEPKSDSVVGYEEQPLPRSAEELERRYLEESMQLSKQQAAEEEREKDRHTAQLKSIQEHFQRKMIQLRSDQAEKRKELVHHEVSSRQQQYQEQSARNYFAAGPYVKSQGNNSYEQYEASTIANIQGLEPVFEPFRGTAQHYGHSAQAYHRKPGNHRGSPGYDYDPYAKSSSASRAYG